MEALSKPASDEGSFRIGRESGSSFVSTQARDSSFDSSSSAGSSSLSPYLSSRRQTLMQRRRDSNESELDFQIQASKAHWSELSSALQPFELKRKKYASPFGLLNRVLLGRKNVEGSVVPKLHSTESLEQMRAMFERLKSAQKCCFFQDFDDLVLRGKIAEGGQAEIFDAECTLPTSEGSPSLTKCVVKVMKQGFSLKSLESQWSEKLCRKLAWGCNENTLVMSDSSISGAGTSSIIGATLLKDGRFAFVLEKYCTDLRKLIDLRMLEKNNRGPPFDPHVALRIMGQIARGMYTLLKSNILHRDLKAANVLVAQFSSGNYREYPDCYVADFECSTGVLGTGFWRAPEVLRALKNRTGAAEACTCKSDVYSFGMTCFEVLTGCLPFEGEPMTNYDLVLSGYRPTLPDYVNDDIKCLLLQCWDAHPFKRPSFKRILKTLASELERWRASSQPAKGVQVPFHGWRSSRTWYLERYSNADSPLDSDLKELQSPETSSSISLQSLDEIPSR